MPKVDTSNGPTFFDGEDGSCFPCPAESKSNLDESVSDKSSLELVAPISSCSSNYDIDPASDISDNSIENTQHISNDIMLNGKNSSVLDIEGKTTTPLEIKTHRSSSHLLRKPLIGSTIKNEESDEEEDSDEAFYYATTSSSKTAIFSSTKAPFDFKFFYEFLSGPTSISEKISMLGTLFEYFNAHLNLIKIHSGKQEVLEHTAVKKQIIDAASKDIGITKLTMRNTKIFTSKELTLIKTQIIDEARKDVSLAVRVKNTYFELGITRQELLRLTEQLVNNASKDLSMAKSLLKHSEFFGLERHVKQKIILSNIPHITTDALEKTMDLIIEYGELLDEEALLIHSIIPTIKKCLFIGFVISELYQLTNADLQLISNNPTFQELRNDYLCLTRAYPQLMALVIHYVAEYDPLDKPDSNFITYMLKRNNPLIRRTDFLYDRNKELLPFLELAFHELEKPVLQILNSREFALERVMKLNSLFTAQEDEFFCLFMAAYKSIFQIFKPDSVQAEQEFNQNKIALQREWQQFLRAQFPYVEVSLSDERLISHAKLIEVFAVIYRDEISIAISSFISDRKANAGTSTDIKLHESLEQRMQSHRNCLSASLLQHPHNQEKVLAIAKSSYAATKLIFRQNEYYGLTNAMRLEVLASHLDTITSDEIYSEEMEHIFLPEEQAMLVKRGKDALIKDSPSVATILNNSHFAHSPIASESPTPSVRHTVRWPKI